MMKTIKFDRVVPAGLAFAAIVAFGLPIDTPSQSASTPPKGSGTVSLLAVPKNGEMGFIISNWAPKIKEGWSVPCPEGHVRTAEENSLALLPEAERIRLLRPENEKERSQVWRAATLGPNNTNICTNYDQFPGRPLNRLVQEKVGPGLDLDGGGKRKDGCAHDTFTGENGEKSVDNQLYRALGCARGWRNIDGSPGEIHDLYKIHLKNGEYEIALILRGVDSLQKDDNVEVILATSDDLPITDAQGNFLPGATFNVTSNPRWRNVLRGRISNGVLTTERADIILNRALSIGGIRGKRAEWDFAGSQLRLEFRADGTLSGIMGGYQPLFSPIHMETNAGIASAQTVNQDCAANYNTLKKLADGYRDPKTGQCTRISSAWEVKAVPAYVVDRKAMSNIAAR